MPLGKKDYDREIGNNEHSYLAPNYLMLCISTIERVLHTPFAGRNQFFNAETTFCMIFLFFALLYTKKYYFVLYSSYTKKVSYFVDLTRDDLGVW